MNQAIVMPIETSDDALPDRFNFGLKLLEEMGLSHEEAGSWEKAMKAYKEERLDILVSGIYFAVQHLAMDESARLFLSKLAEGAAVESWSK